MRKILITALLLLAAALSAPVANAQSPHFLEAAKGNVPGLSGANIVGHNAVVGATPVTVWSGATAYAYPSAGVQMAVVSDSANDVAAGSGAEKVTITYLTTDYTQATEEVTLAGLTPVNTVATNIYRINNVEVTQSANGANTAFNAGNISVTNGGVTYGHIEAGEGRALSTVYTVPKDKIAYFYYFAVSCSSGKSAESSFIIREPGSPPHVHGHIEVYQTTATRVADVPVAVPEGSDVEMRAISSAAGTHVEATIGLFLVDR